MPTIQQAVLEVLDESDHPLSPSDIHAALEERGIETSVDYVYQVLNTFKKSGEATNPRSGRWQLPGREPNGNVAPIGVDDGPALRWPERDADATRVPLPEGAFVVMEVCDERGRVIGRHIQTGQQVGEPVRIYLRSAQPEAQPDSADPRNAPAKAGQL